VRAVRRAERVHHPHVRVLRQRPGEGRIVRLLLLVEAEVLQQHHLGRRLVLHHLPHAVAHAVVGEQDLVRLAQQLGEHPRRRLERQLRVHALRPTQVRGHDELAAHLQHAPERRQRLADPRVVGDVALLVERDVEVHPDEDALPVSCRSSMERKDTRRLPQGLSPSTARASVRSTIRLLKPHSLSYQAITLARFPSMTKVLVASTIDECGLPL
jgi:hypothetical protein